MLRAMRSSNVPLLVVLATAASACGTRVAETGSGTESEGSGPGDVDADSGGEGDTGPTGCEAILAGPTNALGFPAACSPRDIAEEPGYQCCSDDPSRLGVVDLFSRDANDLSAHGQCIEGFVDVGLENGCPVPCNPEWTTAETEAICGPSATAICCQTQELTVRDCIYDVSLQCFRPATGFDTGQPLDCPFEELTEALTNAGYDTELARCHSTWSTSDHDTHQDPGPNNPASACNAHVSSGVDFWQCVTQLGVANQRGFCLSKSPEVQACPGDLPGYIDACEGLNADLGLSCG